jgi:hypothetical protein
VVQSSPTRPCLLSSLRERDYITALSIGNRQKRRTRPVAASLGPAGASLTTGNEGGAARFKSIFLRFDCNALIFILHHLPILRIENGRAKETLKKTTQIKE